MSFDTPSGARGARARGSSGPVSRWVQRLMSGWLRRQGGRFMGMDVLFLTTTGRRTGALRETPVTWFADGEDAWLIVASAAGAAGNPAWYHNIAAHPDRVWIDIPRQRKLRVRPEQLEGARRDDAWRRIVQAQPRYAGYQERTDRPLPVIRLVPDRP